MPDLVPRISLSTFGEFVVAPTSGKIIAVQQAVVLYGRDYNPALDFYRPWREAATEALTFGDDALRLRRAESEAGGVAARHFRELTQGWLLLRAKHRIAVPTQVARNVVWRPPRRPRPATRRHAGANSDSTPGSVSQAGAAHQGWGCRHDAPDAADAGQ